MELWSYKMRRGAPQLGASEDRQYDRYKQRGYYRRSFHIVETRHKNLHVPDEVGAKTRQIRQPHYCNYIPALPIPRGARAAAGLDAVRKLNYVSTPVLAKSFMQELLVT